METFFALLAIRARNSPVTGEFPAQRPVTRSFDVFFDLCLNKRLSKQSWGRWFETPLCPLWHPIMKYGFSTETVPGIMKNDNNPTSVILSILSHLPWDIGDVLLHVPHGDGGTIYPGTQQYARNVPVGNKLFMGARSRPVKVRTPWRRHNMGTLSRITSPLPEIHTR